MNIIFNNQDYAVPDGASIQTLMEQVSPKEPNIAVVVNHRIIGKTKWAEHQLNEGDKVVMFEMVAGG